MKKIQDDVKLVNEQQKKDFEKGQKTNTIPVASITQKAQKAIMDFKDNQEMFSKGVKDTIRRQITVIKGDNASQDEVSEIVANPKKGQDMLRSKLLNCPSAELQNAVSDIIDKCRDILMLQKSMRQCLQMMQELALLVSLTGQTLDNIQLHVDQTQNFTTLGEQKLIDAKKSHKSAKKKMCCIMMLLLATIGVVIIPILITKL